jgi:hypothetical protein
MLTQQEGADFTACLPYVPTPAGNIINHNTEWKITGSLKKISLPSSDILCTSRTLLIPVRYRTAQDAMAICQELGDTGNILHIPPHFLIIFIILIPKNSHFK